ncbi:MAG: hypothetical protein ABI743_12065 [bacterium]
MATPLNLRRWTILLVLVAGCSKPATPPAGKTATSTAPASTAQTATSTGEIDLPPAPEAGTLSGTWTSDVAHQVSLPVAATWNAGSDFNRFTLESPPDAEGTPTGGLGISLILRSTVPLQLDQRVDLTLTGETLQGDSASAMASLEVYDGDKSYEADSLQFSCIALSSPLRGSLTATLHGTGETTGQARLEIAQFEIPLTVIEATETAPATQGQLPEDAP